MHLPEISASRADDSFDWSGSFLADRAFRLQVRVTGRATAHLGGSWTIGGGGISRQQAVDDRELLTDPS